ncbi:MAG: hypothetical protein GY701_33695 [Sulfitobacter sp.]|nr:hypothetical protein [Sulfitobacter sp.]
MAIVLVGGACSSGSTSNQDGASSDTSTASTTSPAATAGADPTTALHTDGVEAACVALDRLTEIDDALTSPQVFTLDEAALANVLSARAEAWDELAGYVHDLRIAEQASELAEGSADLNRVVTAGFTSQGDELEESGVWWRNVLADSLDDQEREWFSDTVDLEGEIVDRLGAACLKPTMGEIFDRGDEPLSDSGTVVYASPVVGVGVSSLWMVPVAGGPPQLLLDELDGWDTVWSPVASPDGDRIAALARHGDGPEGTALLVGDLTGGFELIYQSEQPFQCPSWSPDGRQITVTTFGESRGVLSVELDGTVAEQPTPPFVEFSCAVDLGERGLAFGFATQDPQLHGDTALVRDDQIDVLLETPGCNDLPGSSSPDQRWLAVSVRCGDPRLSGLHVIDLDTQESSLLLHGAVAVPQWSPSGDSLVFGWFPPGDLHSADGTTVWAINTDGTGLRALTGPNASFPTWLHDTAQPAAGSVLDYLDPTEAADYQGARAELAGLLLLPTGIPGDHHLNTLNVDDPNGTGRIDQFWYPPRLLRRDCRIEVDTAPIPSATATYTPGRASETITSNGIAQQFEILEAPYLLGISIQTLDSPDQRDALAETMIEFYQQLASLDCGSTEAETVAGAMLGPTTEIDAPDTGYPAFAAELQNIFATTLTYQYAVGDHILLTITLQPGAAHQIINGEETPLDRAIATAAINSQIARLQTAGHG